MEAVSAQVDFNSPRLVIIGGGPGGYEAAMVGAQLGARVTLIEEQGTGGSAVLTDVVPSKTLIGSADAVRRVSVANELTIRGTDEHEVDADLGYINERLLALAAEQSADIRAGLVQAGVEVVDGRGRLVGTHTVEVEGKDGSTSRFDADYVIVAVGAHPRELPTAVPDGERIMTWKQVYGMKENPEHLIVIGSGVTGAEFASAYNLLGSRVPLVSSRDRVLPGEDEDAARLLEDGFEENGVEVRSEVRANSVTRDGDKVTVELSDGTTVEGSHCLVAVGAIPNTADMGLEEAGVAVSESGHITVDGVSRTTAPHIYAAGDCTGVFPLASVAAMQGRIAVAHLMGDAVTPLRVDEVASNVFTSPEIATVGVSQALVDQGAVVADSFMLDLTTNPRAKMMGIKRGFIKIFARRGTGTVLGGVVVAPRASELIYPIATAVRKHMNVDDLADTVTIYPSLSGSVAEAARRLHRHI